MNFILKASAKYLSKLFGIDLNQSEEIPLLSEKTIFIILSSLSFADVSLFDEKMIKTLEPCFNQGDNFLSKILVTNLHYLYYFLDLTFGAFKWSIDLEPFVKFAILEAANISPTLQYFSLSFLKTVFEDCYHSYIPSFLIQFS